MIYENIAYTLRLNKTLNALFSWQFILIIYLKELRWTDKHNRLKHSTQLTVLPLFVSRSYKNMQVWVPIRTS